MIRIKDIIILDDAVEDLNDGKAFYDQQEPGLGNYFWDSLIADLESLYLFAGIHNKESGYCRMMSKRFPYSIYYEIEENIVRIISILPMRRDPAWIITKLKNRN